MMNRMGAALYIALVLGIVQVAAQAPTTPPTLAMVRERVEAGAFDEAWALVQKVSESPEVLREGITVALARRDAPHAVEWYERLTRRQPAGDRELLSRIGALRAQQLLDDPDPRVVVEACRAEKPTSNAPCILAVRRVADDTNAAMGARLAAAGVLLDARQPGAEDMFQRFLDMALTNEPAIVADAIAHRPVLRSLQPLISLAENGNEDARYIATLALVRRRAKETAPLLRAVAADTQAHAARLIAYIGLAAIGDRDALKVVNETLPLMRGRDLLEAGRALMDLKDARGAQILRSMVGEGEHDLVRLEAAEAVNAFDPALAAAATRALSTSSNPWVRARALEAATRLRISPTPAIRMAMLDANSWVAVRAVQAVTADQAPVSR
ncbi:MAG: hypothetical protein WBC51_10660 [Vicinamibacterales bacterium]